MSGHVVRPHFLHANGIHRHHGNQTDRNGCQRQKRQFPIHKEHCHINRNRDHQVCNSLRHGVSQQNFQTVYIIHEQLFDCAGAFILNDTEGQLFKPFLKCRSQTEQRVISGFVRKIQSPAIEKGLQHQTRQDKSHARNDKGCSNRFTHDQRRYHLISQHKGQDTHQDADQHDGRCCIKPLLMRPCILKYFLKHNSNLLSGKIFFGQRFQNFWRKPLILNSPVIIQLNHLRTGTDNKFKIV